MNPDTFQQFLAEFAARTKAAPHVGTADVNPSTPYYTGPGGLLSAYGLDNEVLSTRMQGNGLATILPAKGTNIMYPLFAYFTGFTDGSGDNKDGVCDDPPTTGSGKSCLQTATFGRYEYQTRTIEINRLGQQINVGERQDFLMLNDPLGDVRAANGIVAPGMVGQMEFKNEVNMRFTELAIEFWKKLSRQVYIGNPANNTAGGGYKEFPGLDLLIKTGHVDAITETSCPTLDSLILNYAFNNVTSTADSAGGGMVNLLTYAMRQLRTLAAGTNLDPVEWVFVMREGLFYELTGMWPCNYLTYRCAPTEGASVNYDATDAINMRDGMRNGMYLTIDGVNYRVVIDPALDELTNTDTSSVPNGSFASDLYILPVRVLGNMAPLYWEYYDYNQGPMQGVRDGNLGAYYWTDGGRYLMHVKTPINWCVQWLAKIEPRLILRTPQLAARIRNIVYTPLMHTRDVFSDQPYYVNGGVTTRSAPSFYDSW